MTLLGFALYRYFPFGGAQRDCLRLAQACQKLGYQVVIYTTAWVGEVPQEISVSFVPVKGKTNHRRMVSFHRELMRQISKDPVCLLIGFNKMPDLDVYYAADVCYMDVAYNQRSFIYRLLPRFRSYFKLENSVFARDSKTVILAISEDQKKNFQKFYGTQEERFYLLPPGISKSICRPSNALEIRKEMRIKYDIDKDKNVILMIASSFKTKGVDRAIQAVSNLPDNIKNNTMMVVVGDDNKKKYVKLSITFGVVEKIIFLSGQHNIQNFLLGADLLIHPAYRENTGTVLLEALVSGLPVLTTDVCGYASHILKAQAGEVVKTPFSQKELNCKLLNMLISKKDNKWKENALLYSKANDLYGLFEKASAKVDSLVKLRLSSYDSCTR